MRIILKITASLQFFSLVCAWMVDNTAYWNVDKHDDSLWEDVQKKVHKSYTFSHMRGLTSTCRRFVGG